MNEYYTTIEILVDRYSRNGDIVGTLTVEEVPIRVEAASAKDAHVIIRQQAMERLEALYDRTYNTYGEYPRMYFALVHD